MISNKKIFVKEIRERYLHTVLKHKQITIFLANRISDELCKKKLIEIFKNLLEPLLLTSNNCYLYKDRDHKKYSSYIEKIGVSNREKYKLHLNKHNINSNIDFWIERGMRGSLVWENKYNSQLIKKLFMKTYNPSVLTNPASGASKNAPKYCRNCARKDNTIICYHLIAGLGLDCLLLYPPEAKLRKTLDYALDYCNLTPGFVLMHKDFISHLTKKQN